MPEPRPASRIAVLGLLAACAMPAQALEVTLDGPLTQGALVRGQVIGGGAVSLNGAPVATTEDGRFVIGFGRDHPKHATLRVLGAAATYERTLAITPRDYATQNIRGLPKKMVTPDKKDLARIRQDQAEVEKARAIRSTLSGFLETFRWPAAGVITGVYGSRRVLNGKPRNPHYGIDIAAPAGTPIQAPASGRVTLAHPDMYYTGATLILDHGYGVSSTFLHMQEIAVTLGQSVAAGDLIGRVGSSGRSTGPHLDWRVNWFDVRVDPALLVGPMPAPDSQPAP